MTLEHISPSPTHHSNTPTPGSIQQLLLLAWPLVVARLSYTAMGVCDTLFVGWIGTAEIAAVGLATTLFFLVNAFFYGTLTGVKIVSSQATGAQDPERAKRAASSGFVFALVSGCAVLALSFFSEPIFTLMGGPETVQSLGAEYFSIRALGAPLVFVMIALNQFLQGTGDTRTPMIVNLVINVLNIGLDLLLIFGLGPIPALGVQGAALATVLAQGVGVGGLIVYVFHTHKITLRPYAQEFRDIMRLGLPIGVQNTLDFGSWALFTIFLARLGEAELAAHQIAIKICSVSFLPGYAISEAICILTGQYTGARRLDLIPRVLRSGIILAVSLMGFMGLLFWCVPELLVSPFQPSPEVLTLACRLLFYAALFQVADGILMSVFGALEGIGDTRFVMIVSVLSSWLLFIPLVWLLGDYANMGARGGWLGLTICIGSMCVVALWRFYSGSWKKHLNSDANQPPFSTP